MRTLILLLFLITLCWCSAVPLIIRSYARYTSDDIICGNLTATENRINSCISTLTWFNNWLTFHVKEDNVRIEKLRDIRNAQNLKHKPP